MTKAYTILFKDAETGGRAMRLTPEGGLTNRKIYAAMILGKDKAEQIADEIRKSIPDATVTVKPF